MEFDRATWAFINSFADWFAAFGTIAAVILALHLARQDKRIRLSVFAGVRVVIGAGHTGAPPEYLTIGVTNVGHREAQIINVGWEVGFIKKRYAVQTIMRDGMSSPIPTRLRDGDEARYYIPLTGNPQWLEDFLSNFVKSDSRHLCVCVYTSVGTVFRSRIENGLRRKLDDLAKNNAAL